MINAYTNREERLILTTRILIWLSEISKLLLVLMKIMQIFIITKEKLKQILEKFLQLSKTSSKLLNSDAAKMGSLMASVKPTSKGINSKKH